jgi:citrate lyase subunit beta/citryl-CoA lyase
MPAMDDRLRRSLLYVPASSEAMLRKAGTRGADTVIVDLEDGVLPEAKNAARAALERLWPGLDLGAAEALVRVNAPGTAWHDADVDATARIGPAGVVVPKCEEPSIVEAVARRIGDMPLFLMVETARGVLAAAELARASHVGALVFGGADFRASVRAQRQGDEAELFLARATLVLAARAAGVGVIDTPYFDYRDEKGLEASARRARALGFDGKTAVHPGQLAVLNRVFAPGEEEVARARRIVEALDDAARQGRGVATVDGEMVEALHAREARRTLARHEAAARRGGRSFGP